MISGFKTCSKCGFSKASIAFWGDINSPDKLSRWCMDCHKEYGRAPKRKLAEKARREDPKVIAYRKSYRADPVNKARKNESAKIRRENTLERLACNLRSRTSIALRGTRFNKNSKLKEYVGCSLEDLRKHLELQFTENMTWNNYGFGEGKWNIDHRIPLASATNEADLFKLCHHSNLQPLWHLDNMIKGKSLQTS